MIILKPFEGQAGPTNVATGSQSVILAGPPPSAAATQQKVRSGVDVLG